MDIDKLRRKRQINVQELNFLSRQQMLECALAYRRRNPSLAWVEPALRLSRIDPHRGVLIKATSVPCGGDEEAAYAEWVGEDRQFYSLEATIRFRASEPISVDAGHEDVAYAERDGESWHFYRCRASELISVDACRNVTASTRVSSHEPGIGKSAGQLALEVLEQVMNLSGGVEALGCSKADPTDSRQGDPD